MGDKRLDVASDKFDADACLSVSDPSTVRLPFPEAKQLPNLFATQTLVPPSVRQEVEASFGKTVRCGSSETPCHEHVTRATAVLNQCHRLTHDVNPR